MTDSKITALEKQVMQLTAKVETIQKQSASFLARAAARPKETKVAKGSFRITSKSKAKKGAV